MMAGIIKLYAPKAKLYICCVSKSGCYEKNAIFKALEHLNEDQQKCQVIVMSYGHYIKNKKDDKVKELIDDLAGKGVICVAAVGNKGAFARDFGFPARFENVISVGSLNEFGNHDEPAPHNPPGKPDVYAPGVKVHFPDHIDEKSYRTGDGTSCAAPAIGGIVALLMQLALKGDVDISKSNVQLIKKIFSCMKIPTTPGGEKKVLDPNDFFGRYGTPKKFNDFLQSLRCD